MTPEPLRIAYSHDEAMDIAMAFMKTKAHLPTDRWCMILGYLTAFVYELHHPTPKKHRSDENHSDAEKSINSLNETSSASTKEGK